MFTDPHQCHPIPLSSQCAFTVDCVCLHHHRPSSSAPETPAERLPFEGALANPRMFFLSYLQFFSGQQEPYVSKVSARLVPSTAPLRKTVYQRLSRKSRKHCTRAPHQFRGRSKCVCLACITHPCTVCHGHGSGTMRSHAIHALSSTWENNAQAVETSRTQTSTDVIPQIKDQGNPDKPCKR